ncbi:hypothetical protein [Marinobacter shengliensis]|uniref:hypothetical protein n=1 Tax=Marinobacter shengliensis TaxID=1389223 RepID=UPI0035B915CF
MTQTQETIAADLMEQAKAQGMTLSADGRVGEADAAQLLAIKPRTLRAARQDNRGPVAYSLPVGSARVSYSLTDLAAFILKRRKVA